MKAKRTPIPNELLEHLLDSEKLKNCFECGICTASCPMTELVPDHYNPRILLENIYQNPHKAIAEPALWLCAWCYRCFRRCPQNLKLPEILLSVRKIVKKQGHLEGFNQALEIISHEIPFPSSFGLVCLHLERVELQEALEDFSKHWVSKRKKTKLTPRETKALSDRVAVLGAGPAGLTAAHELAKKGYKVTAFESSSQPGGMLNQCIPTFRLPRNFLDAEIERIKDLGVEIKTNVKVGRDLTVDELWRQGFKAIFVSVGAHKTRKLGAEGENLSGVFDALDFLRQVNSNEKVKVGEHVAIVGGGNVAIDSARTALRLGAKNVTIFYRRSRNEMPANPYDMHEAEGEGIKIQFLVAPKQILGENEHVSGLECVKMTLGEPDQTGRRTPTPVEGSEFTVPINTVILAIGEAPDLSFLPQEIELTENKMITVEPFTANTNQAGVFAGGDCATGPATIIEAVLAGRRAAECIDRYLKKKKTPIKKQVLEGKKQT